MENPMDSLGVAKVFEIVAKQFAVAKAKISLETSFEKDLAADSLDTVELVMDLEDGFDVEFPDEAAAKVKTVGDVVALIPTLSRKSKV
jgi:acyl carrier protein